LLPETPDATGYPKYVQKIQVIEVSGKKRRDFTKSETLQEHNTYSLKDLGT